MNKWQLSVLLAAGSLVMGSCSMFDPKSTHPYCGEPLDFQQVRLVDMTAYDMPEDRMMQVLKSEVGEYRLVTDKPVQIPRDYAFWNSSAVNGIAGAKSEAASWGCNLLVLMQVKAARNGVGGLQSRVEDRVWMVHVGTVSPSS